MIEDHSQSGFLSKQPDIDATTDTTAQPQDNEPASVDIVHTTSLGDCLVHVAKFHGLPASEKELADKLAVTTEGIPSELFIQAAEKLNMIAQIEKMSLSSIPSVTLPVILFLKDGSCIALEENAERQSVRAYVPGEKGGFRRLSRKNLTRDYAGYCAFLTPDPKSHQHPEDDSPEVKNASWFWSAVRHFWPSYVQVAIAALLVNLLALASPLFVMNVYDRVIPNLAIPTLWTLTFGVSIAILFDLILRILRSWIVDNTGRRIDMAISGRLYDHLVSLRLQARPVSTGMLSNQIREFDTVRDVLTSNAVVAILDSIFIGVFLYVMWLIVGPLVMVAAIAVPTVLILTFLCQFPLNMAARQAQSDASRRHGILVATVGGLEDVKAIGAAAWLRRQWDRSVAASSKSSGAARFWNTLALTGMTTVQQIVSVVVITWGVFLVLEGNISVGALIATNILSGRVLAPLSNVAQTLSRLAHARASLRGLNGFMTLPGDIVTTEQSIVPRKDGHCLETRSLCLNYPGSQIASLQDVSITIRPGERVAIIGQIGSGKSTLGRCVAGLLDPSEGAVLLDDQNLSQFGAASIRDVVVYCSQDPDLFEGSLRDNIIMGRPFASDDEILTALRVSGVDQFAATHPLGLGLPVQERGRNLSGGQKQACALARVLIKKPDILFLDEPTASMDTASERRFMASMKEMLTPSHTLILATHKERLLELVDRIIVMDHGKVVLDDKKEVVLATLKGLRAGKVPVNANAKN
ncbi:type I secretion system permease/ATPase [uncultured Cohaesibacter sp.]|uniref:type I secretion system permease/ATPase n=1 Tax=uncultured Cohaesibacter sp. TaxID=1002546 RepID=UPI00292D5282|nr:type I secretion system permease/ATPase [uncultured Cohaesibacter sp.]